MNTPEPVLCYRCGQPGYTRWIDTKTLSDPGPVWVAGEQYCLTEGCTDLDGSRRLVALTPAQMRDKADAAWMARQRALIEPPTEPSRWARWFMGEWLATGVPPWKDRK